MNKRGGEKLLSVYWFVILIIIAVGIVTGVLYVVGPIDIRGAEAGLLKEKLVDCLVYQGNFKSEAYGALESNNDNTLLRTCSIDLEDRTEKYKGTKQYAVKIDEKEFGNPALLALCGSEGEDVPVCVETVIYVLGKGEWTFLEIKTAVDKNEKNVR